MNCQSSTWAADPASPIPRLGTSLQDVYERLEADPGGDAWTFSRGQREDRLFHVDPPAIALPSFFGPFPGFGRVDNLCFDLASDLANDEASVARFVIETEVTSFRWKLQR